MMIERVSSIRHQQLFGSGLVITLSTYMGFESPKSDNADTFDNYKRTHEGPYSVEQLSHYFNSELGIASNLLHTLLPTLDQASKDGMLNANAVADIGEILQCLAAVHEIGNLCFHAMLEKE